MLCIIIEKYTTEYHTVTNKDPINLCTHDIYVETLCCKCHSKGATLLID